GERGEAVAGVANETEALLLHLQEAFDGDLGAVLEHPGGDLGDELVLGAAAVDAPANGGGVGLESSEAAALKLVDRRCLGEWWLRLERRRGRGYSMGGFPAAVAGGSGLPWRRDRRRGLDGGIGHRRRLRFFTVH